MTLLKRSMMPYTLFTMSDAATNNATEMIDKLTLTMNKIRQAAITKEIIEVVSGAEVKN